MDTFSWVALALLGVCVVLVIFVAAAEAGLIQISRARVRVLAGQGVQKADVLHGYIHERGSLLRALSLGRNLAIAASAGLAVAIVTREDGHSWGLIGGIVVGLIAAVALLQSLPQAIVARNPERWALRLLPFISAFMLVFGGFANVLYLPARAMSRPDEEDEEEEGILRLLEFEENKGELEEDERQMIRGVVGLDETTVREIMTPRTDIQAVNTESPPGEAVKIIIDHGFSRIPLYEKNADTIVGIVYAKDLFRYLAEANMPSELRGIARKPYFVPESKRVDDLLTEMRKQRVHMAIVVDEHGGTAGLVTIEDVLEEIVGEIEDEYDRGEDLIVRVSEREALIDGRVSIDEVNDMFHASINAEEFDTVGGCVVHLLGRMPAIGDEAREDGLRFKVVSVDGHRVKRVRVTQEEETEPETPKNGSQVNGTVRNGRNGKKENGAAQT